MQAEVDSGVALSAATAFLAHLRKHPEAAGRLPSELAREFGLDESFVAQVLVNVTPARRFEHRPQVHRTSPFRAVGHGIRSAWLAITKRPLVFVVGSFLISFVSVWAIGRYFPKPIKSALPGHQTSISPEALIAGLSILGVIGLTFFLHMAVYFRHRSSRFALYGALCLWAALTVFLSWSFIQSPPKSTVVASPLTLFAAASVAMLMVALMYAGFGSLAAVLGGWARIKLEERREEGMARQELLERYFELESRLQKSAYPRPAEQGPSFFEWPIVRWYRNNQYLPNVAIGFILAAIGMLGATQVNPGGNGATQLNAWFFALMFVSITNFLFHILQGYLSGSALRATVGSICIAIGAMIVRFLPYVDPATAGMSNTAFLVSSALDALFMIGVSCAGYLGALVQNRALRDANLQKNDQATLLAEMVRIQWRLSNEAGSACVLVVDAARSSEMKASADPLLVEYTFREYQEWIERICAERSGRIHSTAGDGAVVTFDSSALGLSAAKRLQTDLFRFNKDENRLSQPFRLRIGLHTGEVVGNIGEVQFTEVIDIAAHIEAICPIGGIAVTDDFVARIPDEQVIDLNQEADGHRVFLVANPTEYE